MRLPHWQVVCDAAAEGDVGEVPFAGWYSSVFGIEVTDG